MDIAQVSYEAGLSNIKVTGTISVSRSLLSDRSADMLVTEFLERQHKSRPNNVKATVL